jgi:hypothetical protein
VLTEVIGGLLPSALGVALSPVPIVAIILILGSERARSQGPAFAAGWVVALGSVSVLIGSVVGAATPGEGPSPVVAVVDLLFGALLFLLAAKRWRSRPEPGEVADSPAWMTSLGTMSTVRTASIGAALAALNPKNLALTAAASATIGQAGLDGIATGTAIAVFLVIGSATVLGPVLMQLLAPGKAAGALEPIRRFMVQHNDGIMVAVLLLLGAKLIGNGLGGL